MRRILTTIIISFALIPFIFGQDIVGKYHDYFGSRLTLNSDSTFNYKWNFDLSSSWSKGTWSVKKDTIFLTFIPIFDTLIYFDSVSNKMVDTLVLSSDFNSEKISLNENISNVISSGGQNRKPCPKKLYYKNDKLFEINLNGDLVRKKVFSTFRQKKYKPYYVKD